MHLVFLATTLAVLGAPPANAEQAYAKAVPDLATITCDFGKVDSPAIAARAVEIRRMVGEDRWYIWLEESLPPVPVLVIHQNPAFTLTSVTSPDMNGEIGLISYQPSGEAVLSTHKTNGPDDMIWTAQTGQCIETKGS